MLCVFLCGIFHSKWRAHKLHWSWFMCFDRHLTKWHERRRGLHVSCSTIKTLQKYLPEIDSIFVYRARKLLNIRLFDDEAGKRWQKSVKDMEYEILCVSQFTLYNRLKGNKPDFHYAMKGLEATELYKLLLEKLGTQYSADRIKGMFYWITDVFLMLMKKSHELMK